MLGVSSREKWRALSYLKRQPRPRVSARCDGLLSTVLEFVHEKRGSVRGAMPANWN
jgi:hypothetical protein